MQAQSHPPSLCGDMYYVKHAYKVGCVTHFARLQLKMQGSGHVKNLMSPEKSLMDLSRQSDTMHEVEGVAGVSSDAGAALAALSIWSKPASLDL